jgi:hypothetical protein
MKNKSLRNYSSPAFRIPDGNHRDYRNLVFLLADYHILIILRD